jgi:C4-dicarboxylate-specific signal transduction histidine kinase
MEYDEVRRDQRERFALRVEALEHPDGGAIVRHVDVTARHQARIEIEEQRRQLSHLARVASLGLLSGALAHELNQPLASIGSNAEAARILLKRRTADMQGLDDILRDIITENYRAAEVIHRLRALLRRGETRLQPLNTTELISEVLELAHAELITRRVTVTSVLDPNLPAVLGDRVQLQQVLLNLILNACEATRATPLRERRLWVVASVVGTSTQISIRDSGTGIPAALIDRLFEPFFTTKAEGLGLGLSISRTIVAAHGGRLWAENNSDRGATLYCLLTSAPVEVAVGTASFGDEKESPSSLPALTAAIPAASPLGGPA